MDTGMVAQGEWNKFLTLKNEKILLVVRQHPFVVVLPILLLSLAATLFSGSAIVFFTRFYNSFTLLIATLLLLVSTTIGVITKIIIDWYFHVYILTNRKILEFTYTPLMSYDVNDVLLDRVYCTEIDFQTRGWVRDLLDMGDIILTFDRPTHQEEFVLRDILGCNKIGNFLTQELIDGHVRESITPIWFHGAKAAWGKR